MPRLPPVTCAQQQLRQDCPLHCMQQRGERAADEGDAAFELYEVEADGNCFFRSLADQLQGAQHAHPTYRQRVLSYMESHEDTFVPFLTFGEGDEAKAALPTIIKAFKKLASGRTPLLSAIFQELDATGRRAQCWPCHRTHTLRGRPVAHNHARVLTQARRHCCAVARSTSPPTKRQ